jgi:hypothetical protein
MVLKGLGREIDLKNSTKIDRSRSKKGRDRLLCFSEAPLILYQKIKKKYTQNLDR